MRLTNRVLYTGDSNYLFGTPTIYRPDSGPFTARHIHEHIRLLAESGVDTYLLCPNAQRAFYPSKVIPRMTDGYRRGDLGFVRCFAKCRLPPDASEAEIDRVGERLVRWMDPMLDLEEAGIDWLNEAIIACRRYGIAPWVSIRMNDVHGASDPSCPFLNCPLYADERFRLSGQRPDIPGQAGLLLMGLNYERSEVRDYMFAQIREVVEDYDFEGLQMNWLRCPICCAPVAAQSTIDTMTAWTGEIRDLTRARAKATGKPYPLGIRTSGDLGTMRAIGLDIGAMVQARLIDFVSPSNVWQTNWDTPDDRLRRALGDEVTIYGAIEVTPNSLQCTGTEGQTDASGALLGRTRLISASAPLLRGNASGKLAMGADGIELFNFFYTDKYPLKDPDWKAPSDYSALRGIGQLGFLRGQPKAYTFSIASGDSYFTYWEQQEPLPVILEPLWSRTFSLPMCAEPPGTGLELIIQLVVDDQESVPPLGVSFNGSWPTYQCKPTHEVLFPVIACTHHIPEHRAFNYRFSVATIKEGRNDIVVYNGSSCRADREERLQNSVCIVSVELAVM